MKTKLLFLAAAVGLLALLVWAQMESYERKGISRTEAQSHPSKEIVVGVCWPFSVNEDGMEKGLQLALDEIHAGNLAGGHTIRLVLRDDAFEERKAKRIAEEFANTPEMSAVIGYYYSPFAVKASHPFRDQSAVAPYRGR